MSQTFVKVLTALACTILVAACSADGNIFDNRVNSAGARQLVNDKRFEQVDLPSVITGGKLSEEKNNNTIDEALAWFYANVATTDQTLGRNRIQSRLVAASDQRCNVYLQSLQISSSALNLLFGAAATGAGAAGAIVTGADAARILAGTAGLFSGVRAEVNQDYFSNVAVFTLKAGIDQTRQEVYKTMITDGQTKSIKDYTLEAAIKDAIYYHGLCSLMAGLEKAQSAIKTVSDPGLDAISSALVKVNIARKIQDTNATSIDSVTGGSSPSAANKSTVAGTPLGKVTPAASSPIQELVTVTAAIQSQFANYTGKATSDSILPAAQKAALVAALSSAQTNFVGPAGLTQACQTHALTVSNTIAVAANAQTADSSNAILQHNLDDANDVGAAVISQIDKLKDAIAPAMTALATYVKDSVPSPTDAQKAQVATDATAAIGALTPLATFGAPIASYCQVSG